MIKTFDAIVIGAGQAGPSLAGRLTGAGMSVALIERKLIGGTCVNTGCTPTKTLIASAYAAQMARGASDYGLTIGGAVGVDIKRVKARKDAVSGNSRTGLETWLKRLANCTVYEGHARFETLHDVRVGEELLSADRIFLNVGGRALVPDMAGLDQINYLTNTSMLDLDVLPRHLVIVGGGYVALEFAQMYRRFGSEVTVVEKGPRLIQREDEEVSAAVQDILKAEGIRIRLRAECISFAPVIERSSARMCCWPSVDAPIRTTSASTEPESKLTNSATSWSTTSCVRTCPASGRSAIATARALSPILPTTTSRSSRPTFSMARATLVIGRVPTKMRFPKCRASASVIPARPSGGST